MVIKKYRKFLENLDSLPPTKEMKEWFKLNTNSTMDEFIDEFNEYLLNYTWFDIMYIWSVLIEE